MKKPLKNTKTKNKFVLFVGDEGAILVHVLGRAVLRRMYAPNTEEHSLHGFRELLRSDPNAPIYVLVDMMDQSYVRQTLPPVTQFSIKKLIKRRLERDFGPDDITGAISLGREKEGRKDWNYMLIALANTPQMKDWLALAVELPNPFGGIYLAPAETEQFISQLAQAIHGDAKKGGSSWQLLVSHNKVGGFRQVVLRDGRLIFTRLAQPIGESLPEVIAGNIEQEIVNTVEYLKRLGYQEGMGLDVFIIVSNDIKHVLDSNNIKATAVNVMTPHEAGIYLKLEKAALPEDHYGDVVIATSFGVNRKHVLKLETPYTRSIASLYKTQFSIRAAAAAIVVGVVGWCGYTLFDYIGVYDELDYLASEKIKIQRNLDTTREQTEQLPHNIDRITDVVSIYETFKEKKRMPTTIISDFSEVMEDDVLVKSIHWTAADTITGKDQKETPPITLIMDVEFINTGSDYQAFLEAANNFLKRVHTKFKDYEVQNSKLPGTLSESETFQADIGVDGQNKAELPTGPVSITLTIRGPKKSLHNQTAEVAQ